MANLVVKHVSKVYPTAGPPITVLDDVNFSLAAGQSMAIRGPSGSGKSTLLSIVGTLDHPSTGQVLFDDTDPHQLDSIGLAEFRRTHIGFVFQDHLLLPHLTALENVLVPKLATGRVLPGDRQRALDLLERVGLGHRLQHRPGALSGGEQQRVALARALIHQPRLIIADEPTGNLDRGNSEAIADLLRQLQLENNVMLLIATHSYELSDRFDLQQYLNNGCLERNS